MIFKGETFLNFWLSVLIYNPLEAFILIYFCSIFTEIRINKSIIKHCYILGFINLLFQYYTMYITIKSLSFYYDLFIALIISPVILIFYLKFFIIKKIKIKLCFYACIFNFLSLYLSVAILNSVKILEIWYPSYSVYPNSVSMFITDLIIKILQFLLLYLFKVGDFYYERNFKKNCFKKY